MKPNRRIAIAYFAKFPVSSMALAFCNAGKFNVAPDELSTISEPVLCKLSIDMDCKVGVSPKSTFPPTETKLSAAMDVRSGVVTVVVLELRLKVVVN